MTWPSSLDCHVRKGAAFRHSSTTDSCQLQRFSCPRNLRRLFIRHVRNASADNPVSMSVARRAGGIVDSFASSRVPRFPPLTRLLSGVASAPRG